MKLAFRFALALATVSTIFAADDDSVKTKRDVKTKAAGPDSEKQCLALATDFKTTTGLKINNTFSNYFAEGSMPSLELLAALYPTGTIPEKVNVATLLSGVGPDIDIKSDAGYARTNSRASQNGPLGGLPSFCRFGAFIETSALTNVFMEVWLPLESDPAVPMAPVNNTDFPTNTTGVLVNADGSFSRAPLYYSEGMYDKVEASPWSYKPPAPNDVPIVEAGRMQKGAKETKNSRHRSTDKLFKMVPKLKRRSISDQEKRADTVFTGEDLLGTGTGWNGRLMALGNGGQRGMIPFTELKQVMSRYGFAVTGNNGGHFSGTSAVTFINGSQFDDTLLDFSSRANHVSLQLAEDVIDNFYGKTQGIRVASDNNRIRRYYAASSVGAGRGFSTMQVNPKDFHGYLLGPPAIGFMDMNIGQLAIQRIHNKEMAGNGWFTQGALYGPIRETIIDQCDELDGVKDGIISNPFDCKFKLEPALLCGGNGKFSKTNATCLTQLQIENVYNLYKETTLDGKYVYPAWLPGLEDSASVLRGKNAKASGWTQLVVYKEPKLDPKFNPWKDITFNALQKGKAADPGGFNADSSDLSGFVQAGAKTIW